MLPKKTNGKAKTLSEKVADLILHPNGAQGSEDESGDEDTGPKVVEDFDDYEIADNRSSDIRKRNVKLLSEHSAKYKGKIASRKDFEDSESEDEDGDESEDDESEEEDSYQEEDMDTEKKTNGHLNSSDENDDEENSEDEENAEDEENSEDDEENDDSDNDDDDDDMEDDDDDDGIDINESNIVTENNRQAEIQKGRCVQSQLNMWEKLLELRIHSQKLLTKANQLPDPDTFRREQQDNEEFKNLVQDSNVQLGNLLNGMLQLQQSLYDQFPEIKNSVKTTRKRVLPIADSKSGEPPIKRFAEHIRQNFNEFKSYRNTVLLKWDDRTRLLTPGVGSKKKTMHEDFDIIRKIDNALMNRNILVEKSQTIKKTTAPEETNEDGEESQKIHTNPNIYDDSDFYHQQLRELIEYKSNSSTNASEVTKQLIELQKLRQKMKKKVDTRASKGRKIRYTVHKKLINFMAPEDTSSWTDESKNELCKSLFAS